MTTYLFPAVKILKICLVTFVIFVLSACSNVEKIQHVEVFITETSEKNVDGFFITNGYKKVNAITTLEEGKNLIKTDIKAIEDFYDKEGNYIKTEIIHSNYYKSKVTLSEKGDNRKESLQKPSTILMPDGVTKHFKLENMTEKEKEQVKGHVLSFMDIL
jgi:hypothetical protein